MSARRWSPRPPRPGLDQQELIRTRRRTRLLGTETPAPTPSLTKAAHRHARTRRQRRRTRPQQTDDRLSARARLVSTARPGNTWQGVGPAQPPRSLIHIIAHGRVPVRHPSRTNEATSSGLRAPVDTGPPRPTWNRPRGDARHVRRLRDPGGRHDLGRDARRWPGLTRQGRVARPDETASFNRLRRPRRRSDDYGGTGRPPGDGRSATFRRGRRCALPGHGLGAWWDVPDGIGPQLPRGGPRAPGERRRFLDRPVRGDEPRLRGLREGDPARDRGRAGTGPCRLPRCTGGDVAAGVRRVRQALPPGRPE